MKKKAQWIIAFTTLSGFALCGQEGPATALDTSPHKVRFITVDTDVKLEVLDWGGTGHPLVLLAGLGDTAHVFDTFAPKLTATNHVYGITRRGFGASSAPAPADGNYSADRLGDDVLAVIDSLKLNRPVLVGHSIAGEELSSIGSRHPEKVAGLVYLDAGYAYAYYDRSRGNLQIDANDLRKKLDQLPGSGPLARKPLVRDLLQTNFPQLERDLQEEQKALQPFPNIPPRGAYQESPIRRAIFNSQQRYTEIKCPVLAFYAVPHHFSGLEKEDPVAVAAVLARDLADTSAQSKAFETGILTAHVVRFPNADHYVFRSDEADVLREMSVFVTKLP